MVPRKMGARPSPSGGAQDGPALVPARMINEVLYCERLAALEWVAGEFRDNAFTEQGRRAHRRVDRPTGDLPHPDEDPTDDHGRTVVARSLWLGSSRLGLTARIDLVEVEGDSAIPVEFKRGRRPRGRADPWLPERAQLCAQALLLREHGYRVEWAEIYFVQERRRVRVDVDEDLERTTLQAAERARRLLNASRLPPPLVDSPKCPGCSLVSICLPDETHRLNEGAPEPDGGGRAGTLRPIAVRHETGEPLYVVEHGAAVCKSGGRLEVKKDGRVLARRPIVRTSQVVLFANAAVTYPAANELALRGVPICHYTSGGWFRAITHGFPAKNSLLRLAQYRHASDADRSLALARRFVEGKVKNARVLLRRNTRDRSRTEPVLRDLRRAAADALRAGSVERLLGVEGGAARAYFGVFRFLFAREKREGCGAFDFAGRNRRPPKDPVNALLSFVYALLVKDLAAALLAVGFDPTLGFFHRVRAGRPALALDLAEEFRPLIGDSVVLQVVNNGEVRESDFVTRAAWCNLTQAGRRKVVAAYERRLDTEIRHPLFGYSVNYRRLFELQARLLARAVLEEIPHYPPFVTR